MQPSEKSPADWNYARPPVALPPQYGFMQPPPHLMMCRPPYGYPPQPYLMYQQQAVVMNMLGRRMPTDLLGRAPPTARKVRKPPPRSAAAPVPQEVRPRRGRRPLDETSESGAARKRRRVGVDDEDWIAADDSSDGADTWTSDLSSELISAAGSRATRSQRKRPTHRRAAAAADSDVSAPDDDELGTQRKRAACVLDCPTATGPAVSGVDRVIGHQDFYVDADTGATLGAVSPGPSTPKAEIRPPPENSVVVRRFNIKWTGASHLHNSWLSLDELQGVNGIKKVTNYIKKQADLEVQKQYMGEDELEQIVIALELQNQLDQDALTAERIVTHTKIGDVLVYLVKWLSCAYDQCTWETEQFLLDHNFAHLIKAYELRESRICGPLSSHTPLNQHDLSETSFEPYQSTPPFLGTPGRQMELRDYQLTGVNWIISRMKKDLSVLLADEMGLGKTAQTISVVGHMVYVEKVAGPFLIVVPQSTMDNWLSEFQQWLPDLNVVLHHGNPAAREIVRREEMKIVQAAPMSRQAYEAFVQPRGRLTSMSNQHLRQVVSKRVRYRCDVVITTPSILQCPEDLDYLRAIPWYMMAVDEAHQLKNRESKRVKELSQFKPRYKLLLSGTPLHNNLEELWSLLNFMNPAIYNSLAVFQQKYSEIEKTESVGELKTRQLQQLERELREVVLRRVKRDVLKSLPNKVEWILRVELSPKQASLCKDVVLRNYESLSKSTGGSKLSLQNICIELKKICNHPFLLHAPENREEFNRDLLWSSGKMCLLDKLLTRLKEKGHRVLIFSQMVRMLNLLSTFLTLRGFKHQRLDGTMSRDVRRKAMDHFNAPNSDDFCFLLSTKAGGLGINLTSADTVIIYDSDWNPQNDLQAEARAHRIGQTKTVQIYRVVTKDSVEEDILERAKSKMVLDALVVQGLNVKAGIRDTDLLNGTSTSQAKASAFSREDLTKILMFGATKLWKKEPPAESLQNADGAEPEIDLDRVLAEAEQHTDTSGNSSGRAADLLSSFSNVSDFRYEAPKAKDEDKVQWDSIIPLEERLRFQEPAELGRRKGAGRLKRNAHAGRDLLVAAGAAEDEDDFRLGDIVDDDSDDDASSDIPIRSKRRLKKKPAPPPRKDGALGDRERYRLSRAMIKLGSPEIRMADILEDAKLVGRTDAQTILDEAAQLLARCEEALLAQGDDPRKDGLKKVPVSISLGTGYSCPCRELCDRVAHLRSLHTYIQQQNPGLEEPWKAGSADLVLELPPAQLKPGDANLLKGIYLHGFANWQKIATDAQLAEGVPDFAKKVKSDKIKSRAVKLLQFVHSLVVPVETPQEEEPLSEKSLFDSTTQPTSHPPQVVDNSSSGCNDNQSLPDEAEKIPRRRSLSESAGAASSSRQDDDEEESAPEPGAT